MYEKNPEEKKFELMQYIKMEGLNCCSCPGTMMDLSISLERSTMCNQRFYKRNGVRIPITDEMYKVFYNGIDNGVGM